MAQSQNFRSALNGFNREDVVHYLEYMNSKHSATITQMNAEADDLRRELAELKAHAADQNDSGAAAAEAEELRAEVETLKQQLADSEAEKAELSRQLDEAKTALAAAGTAAAATPAAAAVSDRDELETYRRAERVERMAKERADQIYLQADTVLSDATGKVDAAASQLTEVSADIMRQINALQAAVESSRKTLQDAAASINEIRPKV